MASPLSPSNVPTGFSDLIPQPQHVDLEPHDAPVRWSVQRLILSAPVSYYMYVSVAVATQRSAGRPTAVAVRGITCHAGNGDIVANSVVKAHVSGAILLLLLNIINI